MNLTIVTETFPPEINGVAMTFGNVARELARRGHLVTVCHPRRNDLKGASAPAEFAELLVPGVPIPRYPTLRFGLPAHRALSRRWGKDRPDLVHVATEGPLGCSAITIARRLRIPVTSSFHTNFHAYTRHYGMAALRAVTLSWLRRVHNRTLCTFAPTAEICDELRLLGFARVALMSRGVDTTQFSPLLRSEELRASWGVPPDVPVVLHVGRIAAEKNYPLLFRAYEALRALEPRIVFVLIGDGPLRPALQRAYPWARFTGFVPQQELARIYASSDMYLHASLTETFGNVLTEAMASGLAVVGFDYAAGRQFIRSGENGLTVPCDDPDGFLRAAQTLARSAPLRAQLGNAACATLAAQSWRNVVAQFEADLERVIEGAKTALAA